MEVAGDLGFISQGKQNLPVPHQLHQALDRFSFLISSVSSENKVFKGKKSLEKEPLCSAIYLTNSKNNCTEGFSFFNSFFFFVLKTVFQFTASVISLAYLFLSFL